MLGDGLGQHAELVTAGDLRLLRVLAAHEAGAAGREDDGGQGGVRGLAHVVTRHLAS